MTSTPKFGRRGAAAAPENQARIGNPVVESRSNGGVTLVRIRDLLFSFRGRISRQTYCVLIGCALMFCGTLNSIDSSILSNLIPPPRTSISDGFTVLSLITLSPIFCANALLVWIVLALGVKRWHDRGKSGFWTILSFIPVIGWTWQIVECGFLEGTSRANRFGPSPKESQW